jgi:selenocysteine-specific elongation factor
MKTYSFDAALSAALPGKAGPYRGQVRLAGVRTAAEIHDYQADGPDGSRFARVQTGRPLEVFWKDRFEVLTPGGEAAAGGVVLHPRAAPLRGRARQKRLELLTELALADKDMLLGLAVEAGIQGLRAEELADFARLAPAAYQELAARLEEEGRLRVISFSPLFVISREGLDFLKESVLGHLRRFHERHPDRRGLTVEDLKKRFRVAEDAVKLAVMALAREDRLIFEAGLLSLPGFKVRLADEDRLALERLERLLAAEGMSAVSLEEIGGRLGLKPGRARALLEILVARRKVVRGGEGFYVHSPWLEELISRLRSSGRRELTVAEFKSLAGLSRKYAIPLLELLDEMGVTKRKGALREVLKPSGSGTKRPR